VKRGLIVFTISSLEVREDPLIKLPHSPSDAIFISASKVLISCKSGGIYLVETGDQSILSLFSLPSEGIFSKQTPYLVNILKPNNHTVSQQLEPSDGLRDSNSRMRSSIGSVHSSRPNSLLNQKNVTPVEVIAYCTKDTQFFRISTWSQSSLFVFYWTSPPISVGSLS
jgi:hypothetical protein